MHSPLSHPFPLEDLIIRLPRADRQVCYIAETDGFEVVLGGQVHRLTADEARELMHRMGEAFEVRAKARE